MIPVLLDVITGTAWRSWRHCGRRTFSPFCEICGCASGAAREEQS